MKQRFLQMLFLGIKQFRDPYYQGFAAQISFYLLLSIVPIVILLTQLLGYFGLDLMLLMDWVADYTGGEVYSLLGSILEFRQAGAVNIVFVVLALWAASRAQFAIMRITNYTFSEGETTGKGYFRERFRAVWTMGTILLILVVALMILAYGELVLETVLRLIHLNPEYFLKLFNAIKWMPGLLLYFFMISFIYFIMPSERVPFRKILPGSIFASVGFLLVTLGFARYNANMANYDILYGTLSSIVALMFWFYALAWVICLGILFNKVWDDTSSVSKRRPPVR